MLVAEDCEHILKVSSFTYPIVAITFIETLLAEILSIFSIYLYPEMLYFYKGFIAPESTLGQN